MTGSVRTDHESVLSESQVSTAWQCRCNTQRAFWFWSRNYKTQLQLLNHRQCPSEQETSSVTSNEGGRVTRITFWLSEQTFMGTQPHLRTVCYNHSNNWTPSTNETVYCSTS